MVCRTAVLALVAAVVVRSLAAAQDSRVYVGGTFNLVTQTHSDSEPLGGTIGGGSLLFAVQVSPRVAVEFEPSFSGLYSRKYSYQPKCCTVDVVASRRDTFFAFQVRTRVGVLEPVVGASYVHATISRHATVGSTPYFDEGRSADVVAAVVGVDAAVKVTPHFYFVPTFRAIVKAPPGVVESFDFHDALGPDTSTGPFVFRYGAGVRVTF